AVTATALAATLARAPGRFDEVAEPVGNPRFTGLAHSPVGGRVAQTAESAQTLQFAPFALRLPACPSCKDSRGRLGVSAGRGRRGVVAVALDGHRSADALADQPLDDDDPFPSLVPQSHLVSDADRVRGLDALPVHSHMPAAAGGGAEGTRLDQAYGPDPTVDPDAPTLRRPGRLGSRHGSGDPGIRSLGRLRAGSLALGRRRVTGPVSARPVVLRTLRSH